MSEPDHVIVKPIPNLAKDGFGAAFPFFYIEPKKYEKVLRKYYPEERGPVTNIDPIGNSPVIVGKVCSSFLVVLKSFGSGFQKGVSLWFCRRL